MRKNIPNLFIIGVSTDKLLTATHAQGVNFFSVVGLPRLFISVGTHIFKLQLFLDLSNNPAAYEQSLLHTYRTKRFCLQGDKQLISCFEVLIWVDAFYPLLTYTVVPIDFITQLLICEVLPNFVLNRFD